MNGQNFVSVIENILTTDVDTRQRDKFLIHLNQLLPEYNDILIVHYVEFYDRLTKVYDAREFIRLFAWVVSNPTYIEKNIKLLEKNCSFMNFLDLFFTNSFQICFIINKSRKIGVSITDIIDYMVSCLLSDQTPILEHIFSNHSLVNPIKLCKLLLGISTLSYHHASIKDLLVEKYQNFGELVNTWTRFEHIKLYLKFATVIRGYLLDQCVMYGYTQHVVTWPLDVFGDHHYGTCFGWSNEMFTHNLNNIKPSYPDGDEIKKTTCLFIEDAILYCIFRNQSTYNVSKMYKLAINLLMMINHHQETYGIYALTNLFHAINQLPSTEKYAGKKTVVETIAKICKNHLVKCGFGCPFCYNSTGDELCACAFFSMLAIGVHINNLGLVNMVIDYLDQNEKKFEWIFNFCEPILKNYNNHYSRRIRIVIEKNKRVFKCDEYKPLAQALIKCLPMFEKNYQEFLVTYQSFPQARPSICGESRLSRPGKDFARHCHHNMYITTQCCICFENLYDCDTYCGDCGHMLHYSCAIGFTKCPICRKEPY
jgi:hypothetical protein